MLKHSRFLIMSLGLTFLVSAAGLNTLIAKDSANDERERAVKAADVLSEIMQIPEDQVPDQLMERAAAIAVIPNVVKGAIGIGGEYGKGLVSERGANGQWSPPSYLTIGGGNFGFQIGVQSTDVILIFTNREGFQGLLDGKVKLGADMSVVAGPVGRKAEVATDVLLKSAVFAYSRSKGLFAGVSLDGSVVSIDNDANRRAYGREVTAQDILVNHRVRTNEIVAPFVRAVERYSPAKRRVTD